MQTALKAARNYEQDKVFREKRWLAWLLQVWDENSRMPIWITIKRTWPNEYQQILQEFGSWQDVEVKMKEARLVRDQALQKRHIADQQILNIGKRAMTYTLEDYLLGILKVQSHLKIRRLPSLREVSQYADILGTPHGESYQRRLLTKDNWGKYLNLYLETPEEERPTMLKEMERDLEKQKIERRHQQKLRQVAAGKTPRPDKLMYSAEDCLEGLCRMQNYLQITTLPTKAQIEQCSKEIHTPSDKALHRCLGPKADWHEMLIQYQEHCEIERFVATYNNLQIGSGLNLSGLWERMRQMASSEERLLMERLEDKLGFSTAKTPVVCELLLHDKEYEVTIRAKG